MVTRIGSSYSADTSNRYLNKTNGKLGLALARLAAGRRVLSAKDDAASLAIGSRLEAENAAQRQAYTNAGQAASMLQTADGGMARVNDMLTRMKSLAVQAGSGQLSADDRKALNTEFQALASEVDRVASDTDFGGKKLLDGSSSSVDVKVGTGTSPSADNISAPLGDVTKSALGISGLDITSASSADTASTALTNAIDKVQQLRADNGATSNRLDLASANIATAIENTEAARSRLIDLDVAAGSSQAASLRTQLQSGIYASTQANNTKKTILDLLS